VPVGAHYGWPWVYWKKFDDDRVKWRCRLISSTITCASLNMRWAHIPRALGLAFAVGGRATGADFASGAFIARHGSWNRKPLSGYDVVFVKFDANGNPQGLPVPVLTGFLNGKGQHAWPPDLGRPLTRAGALLLTDDTAGIVWRVIAPGAEPAAAIKPVVTARMPAQRSLEGDPNARYTAGFKKDETVKER
jgi:glucose/arabinose dehydrogenase